ncbi:MAG: SpoIID/LytB domain-containing protein [Bacteroidales bacterium]
MRLKLYAVRILFLLLIFLLYSTTFTTSGTLPSHIRIRLFANRETNTLFFSAVSGKYSISIFPGETEELKTGETAVIIRYNGRLALKTSGKRALLADSVFFIGLTGNDIFQLYDSNNENMVCKYSGGLYCFPDMGSILLINECEIEEYIAGAVKTEGGKGKSEEYFKAQAVITRTYTYRNMNRHETDGFNLCDDTHCQAFHGITDDQVIINAVNHTKGMVIVTPDSNLIISAFHSNCGGQTSPSGYVWMLSLPYLNGVTDPYCTDSKNAEWEKKISTREWYNILSANGYHGESPSASHFVFRQNSRMMNYTTGTFSMPFNVLRNELGLRSAWFSVYEAGDSLLLKGRGYGHGVGLCQEGAMVMAEKGVKYEEIIKFYYQGVEIINIENAKKIVDVKK